jgi:hypothetical protein
MLASLGDIPHIACDPDTAFGCNASKPGRPNNTLHIIYDYARRDSRFKVFDNTDFLDVMSTKTTR